jgi:hypothetical protein
VSWWGERPAWIRHLVYWTLASGLVAVTAFDKTTTAVNHSSDAVAGFAWFFIVGGLLAIMGLLFTLREWPQLSPARNISRCLVLFTFFLGFMAAVLFFTRRWGVHIEACRTVGGLETCQGEASAQRILSMLAWHAANVVPVLDIPNSLEWTRPARSTNALVEAGILIVRLWVAIGILAVLKRVWDKWQPESSTTDAR